jgi:hypothetical protein
MITAGFEPAIPASERPQTYVLDRAATGIGEVDSAVIKFDCECVLPPPFQSIIRRHIIILSGFTKLGIATISFVMSVRPHETTRLPLDGFS